MVNKSKNKEWADNNKISPNKVEMGDSSYAIKAKIVLAGQESTISIPYSEIDNYIQYRLKTSGEFSVEHTDLLASTRCYNKNDPLVRQAVEVCLSKGEFSTTLIQAHLKKGHGFAAGLGIWLENHDIIGPCNGNRPRKLLIKSMEEFDKKMEETQ